MGAFALGCGLGWSAPCVEILRGPLGDMAINVIASVFPIGAALGTIAVPFLVDTIGRKWTMLVLVPIMITGWILIIFAGTLVPLYVLGRIMTGACGGMCCVLSPMYSAEISERQIRGMTGVFFQLLLVIGILYVYLTGFTENVIMISSLCCVIPILFGVTMFFMPESPLFYMIKNKEEEARKSMRFFRGPSFDIEPEINLFKEQVERGKLQKRNLAIFVRMPMLKTLCVAYGLMFVQQFSGINAIIFYGFTIFEATSVGMASQVELVIFGTVQVVACVAATLLIDKLGRKLLMVISLGTMCVCLAALAAFFVLTSYQPQLGAKIYWIPLTSICVYILAFCLGAGPIPWAYMGEIFPTRLKSAASSSAAFFNWLLAFTVTMAFPSAAAVLDYSVVFAFFAVLCGASIFFVFFCMVETKGKTFAEIERAFGTHVLALNAEERANLNVQ
ncbi:TRE12 protein, partial [Acromyrmex insinuator]